MAITVTRQLIADIKAMLRKREYWKILKWDRNQPRGPKGSPDGGKWVKAVSTGGTGPSSTEASTFRPPEYGFGSTEDRRMVANQASYAAIMNAPTGTGFKNPPRGTFVEEAQARAAADDAAKAAEAQALAAERKSKVESVLKTGSVTDSRPLGGGGINTSMIVTLEDGTEAVYKPEVGETWTASFSNSDISQFVTNRDFSLAEREATAYEISKAMGLDFVPATVLRESLAGVDVGSAGSGDSGGGYDEDYARERYDEYREKQQDRAYEAAGDEMADLYQDAQKEHVTDVENRIEELKELWDEEKEAYPNVTPYGAESVIRQHPVLPMGSAGAFERQEPPVDTLDPLEMLTDSDVEVAHPLSGGEKDRLRVAIREKLQEGYREIGELDEDAAREHLDRDEWYEAHQDTEMRLVESKIQSFDSWRHEHGYDSDVISSGGNRIKNPDAPHPNGGSLQDFRSNAESYGDLSDDDAARMAALDYVLGTMDRHGHNLMYEDNQPIAIDNGYSLPAADNVDDFTFRSVAVSKFKYSSKTSVSAEVRKPILATMNKTDWQALVDRHPNMNQEERESLLGRVDRMKEALQTDDGLKDLWAGLNLTY